MKKILTVAIALFSFVTLVKAQYVNIPDTNFRNFLIAKYPTCFNSSSQMDTTCTPILQAQTIYISGFTYPVDSIDGIEYFKNLQFLTCDFANLKSLPVLPKSLKSLVLDDNKFTSLPTNLPDSITSLTCSNNLITTITNLPPNLQVFLCSNNQLTNLPPLP